jgi:hypothetical protein
VVLLLVGVMDEANVLAAEVEPVVKGLVGRLLPSPGARRQRLTETDVSSDPRDRSREQSGSGDVSSPKGWMALPPFFPSPAILADTVLMV